MAPDPDAEMGRATGKGDPGKIGAPTTGNGSNWEHEWAPDDLFVPRELGSRIDAAAAARAPRAAKAWTPVQGEARRQGAGCRARRASGVARAAACWSERGGGVRGWTSQQPALPCPPFDGVHPSPLAPRPGGRGGGARGGGRGSTFVLRAGTINTHQRGRVGDAHRGGGRSPRGGRVCVWVEARLACRPGCAVGEREEKKTTTKTLLASLSLSFFFTSEFKSKPFPPFFYDSATMAGAPGESSVFIE